MHKQKHRGIHPKDEILFGSEAQERLGQAVQDYYFLRTRHYSEGPSLRVVGDHFSLHKRQRFALQRIVSSLQEVEKLKSSEIGPAAMHNQLLAIDAFNLLIFMEVNLSDGFIFQCIDGTYRDIASIHGNYHQVLETGKAIIAIGNLLDKLEVKQVNWYLDQPVSNSGKLAGFLREIAEKHHWNWVTEVVTNADQSILDLSDAVSISNDRIILSRCEKWFNLSRFLVDNYGQNNSHLIRLTDLAFNRENQN